MSTLETQYKNYKYQFPESTKTFEEWREWFGKSLVVSLNNFFEKESKQTMNKQDEYPNWPFWEEILMKPDGTINLEQLKKELEDFSFIIHEVPKVYLHVTGDTLSKPNYHADGVISCADEHYRNHYTKCVQEMVNDMVKYGEISLSVKNLIENNMDRYL